MRNPFSRPLPFGRTGKARWAIAGLLAALVMAACGGGDFESTPKTIALSQIGVYEGGAPGAAEIAAYDAASRRLFVVNGSNGTVDVLDLSNPASPTKVSTLSVATLGAAVNSVAVHNGLVALAIEASPKTSPGKVAFYRASDLSLLSSVTVGALPDMLFFTPDGRRVVVANEGEPNSYGQADSVDPEGSISIITVNGGTAPSVETADFRAWIGREAELRAQGVRIYGPGANAAQDLEPEYITISEDGATAWVTLQENNAIAEVDIASARVTAIRALGLKDFSAAGFGLDPSDEDGGADTNSGTPAVKIVTAPVKGMYMPDAIASYRVGGSTYLVTANEGDARADWPGFNEETRVRTHCAAGLDPAVFGADAARLLFDSALGRLRITTTPNGGSNGKNASGQCTTLQAFGGRSISIWQTDGSRVWDSGDDLERRTTSLPNVRFNASHDNDTLDSRSPSKGPEPEGLTVVRFGERHIAFVVLERVGGIVAYDVTNPSAPTFVTYLNTRSGVTGPRGPEGITYISANRSPNGKPLLVVGHEVSGTTAIYEIALTY